MDHDEDGRRIRTGLPPLPKRPFPLSDLTPIDHGTSYYSLDPDGISLLGTDATDVLVMPSHPMRVLLRPLKPERSKHNSSVAVLRN